MLNDLQDVFARGIASDLPFYIVQTVLIAPITTLLVSAMNRSRERDQRNRMIPHLLAAADPLRRDMDQLVRGKDGEMALGGLEMFRRQFESMTEAVRDEKALSFYLGYPAKLSSILNQRVTAQCDYIDGQLDLFAPHFRTEDAVRAQALRAALRRIEAAVSEVQEGIDVLASNVPSTCRFLTHLASVDDGDPDAERLRVETAVQAMGTMERRATELAERYSRLPDSLDAVATAITRLVEGFYDNKVPFDRILARVQAAGWYQQAIAEINVTQNPADGREAQAETPSDADRAEADAAEPDPTRH